MCGIVGAINTRINLDKALEIIKHRGPDAQGVYENSVVQFGHVRLSIIDLSNNSNQPFIDQSTGSALVFNGEIYNYKQLKSSLQDRVKFLTESDTEVLFFGLQLYGIEFINELQGMYSFAYYDGIKNQSYLVRDRFGIKPLYLKKDGGGYLFSSEIKAIRNAVFTPDQINKERLADFIYRRRLDHTNETFYNSLEQVPAGSFLIFEHDYGTSGIVN